jgi:hypothetical protein
VLLTKLQLQYQILELEVTKEELQIQLLSKIQEEKLLDDKSDSSFNLIFAAALLVFETLFFHLRPPGHLHDNLSWVYHAF